MKLKLKNRLSFFTLSALITVSAVAQDYSSVCDVPTGYAPLESWNFNAGESPDRASNIIDWIGDHGGVIDIPETNFKGIKFRYKGKHPKGDSSSEFRYSILSPQAHVWEQFSIYQPTNFYHRLNLRIEPKSGYASQSWNKGDRVETTRGATARVVLVEDDYLWLEAPSGIYDISWGQNKVITNLENNESFISKDSKFYASNNKLSAMWQGKYSNAAMIAGTTAIPSKKGGKEGIGYCELLGSATKNRRPYQVKNNMLREKHAICFDPVDNGTIVDFIIERKRSTDPDFANGIYSIWKRTKDTNWELIFRNESVPAYQPTENYFDNGYIFGWSNSGFNEETNFYLLNWSIWDKQPHFLPN